MLDILYSDVLEDSALSIHCEWQIATELTRFTHDKIIRYLQLELKG